MKDGRVAGALRSSGLATSAPLLCWKNGKASGLSHCSVEFLVAYSQTESIMNYAV